MVDVTEERDRGRALHQLAADDVGALLLETADELLLGRDFHHDDQFDAELAGEQLSRVRIEQRVDVDRAETELATGDLQQIARLDRELVGELLDRDRCVDLDLVTRIRRRRTFVTARAARERGTWTAEPRTHARTGAAQESSGFALAQFAGGELTTRTSIAADERAFFVVAERRLDVGRDVVLRTQPARFGLLRRVRLDLRQVDEADDRALARRRFRRRVGRSFARHLHGRHGLHLGPSLRNDFDDARVGLHRFARLLLVGVVDERCTRAAVRVPFGMGVGVSASGTFGVLRGCARRLEARRPRRRNLRLRRGARVQRTRRRVFFRRVVGLGVACLRVSVLFVVVDAARKCGRFGDVLDVLTLHRLDLACRRRFTLARSQRRIEGRSLLRRRFGCGVRRTVVDVVDRLALLFFLDDERACDFRRLVGFAGGFEQPVGFQESANLEVLEVLEAGHRRLLGHVTFTELLDQVRPAHANFFGEVVDALLLAQVCSVLARSGEVGLVLILRDETVVRSPQRTASRAFRPRPCALALGLRIRPRNPGRPHPEACRRRIDRFRILRAS